MPEWRSGYSCPRCCDKSQPRCALDAGGAEIFSIASCDPGDYWII
jgi:hypothetical protein